MVGWSGGRESAQNRRRKASKLRRLSGQISSLDIVLELFVSNERRVRRYGRGAEKRCEVALQVREARGADRQKPRDTTKV